VARARGDRYAIPADGNRPPLSAHHRACVLRPTILTPSSAPEPFGRLIGERINDANLFHLDPLVCLKLRGRKLRGREAIRVTETALANYVVNSDPDGVDHSLESKPLLAFAVYYVTAHLDLDLVDEQQAEEILNYCEAHLEARR
jgi:hypothetical protein